MAVIVKTERPRALLHHIYEAIDEGSIIAWEYDGDGDLMHIPDQWRGKAWMHPRALDDRLVFNIRGRKDKPMKKAEYAVYHGRLSEMLLSHFDGQIKSVICTSMPTRNDRVKQL